MHSLSRYHCRSDKSFSFARLFSEAWHICMFDRVKNINGWCQFNSRCSNYRLKKHTPHITQHSTAQHRIATTRTHNGLIMHTFLWKHPNVFIALVILCSTIECWFAQETPFLWKLLRFLNIYIYFRIEAFQLLEQPFSRLTFTTDPRVRLTQRPGALVSKQKYHLLIYAIFRCVFLFNSNLSGVPSNTTGTAKPIK